MGFNSAFKGLNGHVLPSNMINNNNNNNKTTIYVAANGLSPGGSGYNACT